MPRKRQRVFQVTCDMSVEGVTRAGSSINLTIKQEGKKLGEIQLGRGSLTWIGKWKGHDKSRRFPWDKFAETMNRIAGGAKVKKPN
jgi:hypothetical protein